VKVARMWNPLPNVDTYQSLGVRIIAAAWMVPIYALAAAGAVLLWRRKASPGRALTLFLLMPAVYLTLIHCLFVGSVRYRLGAMPMLEVLAGVTIVWIITHARRDQRVGTSDGGI